MNVIRQTTCINIYLISKILMNNDAQNISTNKNASFIFFVKKMDYNTHSWCTVYKLLYIHKSPAPQPWIILGKKHFPIPYNIKRIGLYLLVMLSIYLIITITDINMWINSLYLIAFIILIFILEKPKKIVFSNPKLFN